MRPYIKWALFALAIFSGLTLFDHLQWIATGGFPFTLLFTAMILGALYGLDALFLWMEREGWIYYRKTKGGGGATSGVLLAINPIEPEKQYLVEAKSEERKEWINEEDGARE